MKKIILLLATFLFSFSTHACTTFVLKGENNQLVFGRNLDWVSDNGVVVVNKRNISKSSLVFLPDAATSWVSKYGSITFNQFGKEFPFGGINEVGLVVEIMLVSGSYPEFDERTALNELQWVQYQLDNCKTIQEVIDTDKNIRISKISQMIHFLICDKKGNTAVIEFKDNKMIVFQGENLPYQVLENDTYEESLGKHENGEYCRFSKATNQIKNYKNSSKNIIDFSFDILQSVALDSAWSIVYDIQNLEVHFKTSSNTTVRKFKLKSFDFDCKDKALLYDMAKFESGAIDKLFIPFNQKLNKEKFDDAIRSNQIMLPPAILRRFDDYNEECRCE